MQTMLERALEIAREAHAEDVDKAGRPVIEHVLRVVDAVEGEDAKVVAALHDVIEDGHGWSFGRLCRYGIDRPIAVIVSALTRRPGTTYADYIDWVALNPVARVVKVADLRDHLHPDRVGVLRPSHAERYRRALAQLGATPSDPGRPDGRR